MIPQITEINFPSYATLNSATITLSEMGDRNITTQIKIDGDIVPDFSGWELEFKGERFILPVKEPQAAKDNTSRRSIVDLTFSSWAVQEMKRYFFVEMTSIESGTAIADKYKASLGLNIENFVIAFNNVLNYYFNGNIEMDLFGSGTGIYSAEPAFFEIDYTHIWDVLQKIYEIYQVRWTITYDSTTEKYVIKVGYPAAEIDDHEFEYGYEGGLLRFERQVQDYDITNVLLGRGGEKNLPYRYFKKVDPGNPNWVADPDAIPELKNIYFENLRDINFRRYVQGWKTNPNRILEEGDVVETYDSARGETDFAYAKGHTDERFNPVEYVKDDASIAVYGERWGALENADDIYPTIQGIEVDPYGRIDQVVDVEPVTTDNIEAMAADAAEVTNVAGASRTEWINYNSTLELDINGADFSVPEGKVGNLTIQNTWFDTILYAKRGNDQVNVDPADAVHELVGINTTLSYVTVVNRSTGTELPPAGIPAGNYFYKLHIVVKAEFESSMYNSVNVTVGVNGMKLTTSEGSANAWKPTFDIWVKNIWNTTQQSGESDEQYAARVWEPILGDRTGEEAKVAFSTGFLSISEDYNFTIASIPVVDRTKTIDGVASEWRITLIKSDAEYEATGKYIPNAETGGNASAGDYFFFTGIDMPWAYVLWAEEKLNAYKETELAKLKQINPTWIIRIDKVRANTKEQGELEYLADRFASGAKLRVKDKRFTNGQVLTLYVQTVTYTWQEPSSGNPYLVPDIEVVLSDKIEVSADPVTQLEGDVQNIQSTYAKISDIESAIRRVASPIFLKKTGESERSLSPTRFSSLMASESFRQGDIGGQGWGAYTDGEGHSVLEADTIVVRKDMRVNTLTINQIAYLGGKQIISAAAMECTKVDDTNSGYVCYFDQKQGSVANLFKVDDIVLGQVWNADESEQRYYKRKVIAVGTDSITLSKEIADGDGVPQPKDIMVQYGSYSDTSRQYVIVRDVIGGGYERMLSGLTTVYANGDEYYFAGRQSGSTPRWFVGDANGQHASYQDGVLNITGRLSVTTQVDKGNGTYESLSNYLSNLQDQIDGNIQTWYATGEPTLQNYPANTWPTVEDKNNHIGDLYYESETGKAYRFMLDGNTYKWVQIADEDIAAALALAQQNQTAIAGLAYLKAATNQGTLVQGGLVLTSMIQLGQTEEGTYKVYSGINGIMDTTALGNGIAAWYGGPMADIGADSTLTDFAKSLFRFDGSGYLASGNIKWDLNGNGEIPGISWNNGRITLSPDIYLQGGDRLTAVVDAVNRMYTQFAYDSHDNIVVKPTNAFYIPTSAPEYPLAGGVALWYDYNGNYSELPGGGGVADIYDLTIRRGSVSVGPYNLGEQAADIDLASLFSGYATESYVGNRISALNLGTASQKDFVTTIVSGGAGLPTAEAIYTFVNNAVTAAQPYKGVSSTAITDGGTEMPTISGYATRTKGDVVAYNKKEFIWEGDKWRELGDEGSYALKTVQVIAGTGLAGGGAISQDVTLSLSSATIASLGLADSALQADDLDGYVNAISQGTGNYVTGITKSGKTLTITRGTLPTTIALSNVTGADDLKAIEALTGTSGFLKKTAANTWALDTNSYLIASSLKGLTLQVNGETAGTYNPNTAATINLSITEFATSEEDDAMFTSRQVPSVAVGDVCKITSVKGKSIVWNQLITNGNFADGTTGWSFTRATGVVGTNEITISAGTAPAATTSMAHMSVLTAGHKYYIAYDFMGLATEKFRVRANGSYLLMPTLDYVASTQYTRYSGVASPTSSYTFIGFYPNQNSTATAGQQLCMLRNIVLIDLTVMFGSAVADTMTAAEFEALYPLPYYDYDTGELVNNAASGVEMLDARGNSLGTIPLNITGLTSGGVQIFPDGMKSAGSVYDEWSGSTATKRIGSRAYQSGDENDSSVVTDGTTTYYPLSTPVTYTVDALPDTLVQFDAQGTQRRLPEDTASSVSAPMVCDFQYGANIGDLLPTVDYKIRHGHVALADEAIKLQTTRTIWGQSFDGTANVFGALTEVTDITGTGLITMPNGKFSSSFIIPHIAPTGTLESEESYLYASATGNFSEEAPDAVGIASVIQTSSSSESGGTNIVTVTLTDGSKSTFGVRNGQQGNSGYSGAAGELEVVNNLTDGGATAALSAEMGKILDGKIGALKDKNLNKRLFGTRVSGSAPWPDFVVSDYIDIPASHFTSRMYNWGTRPGYGFRYVDSGGNIITLTRNTGTLFNSFVIDYYDIPASAVTIRFPLYNLTEEQIASIFIGSDSDADYLSWPFLAKGTLPAVTSAWYAGDSDEIKAIVDAYPEYKDMTGYPSVRVSSKNLFSLKDVMFYGYNTVSPGYPTYYSGYMPVEAGKKYTLSFKGTFSPQTYYYTSEKVYIERSLYATSTAPATAAFARVALTSYNDVHLLDPSSEVQFEQSEFATSYEPYFIYGTDDISVPLKDKGFAFLGDSFTAGNLWCTTMASILKAKVVYNAAVSGSTWSTNAPDQADRLISSGSTPDYILCFLGVNDANNTMPLGNIVYSNNIAELESSTFTGGVQRVLNKLMNAFPSAVIKIGWTPAGQSFTGTLDVSQYINRLKDLSIVYGVQFVETRYCGISPYINADADYYEYGTGGGHPTATGQTRIGEAMARIMASNQ